MASIKAVVVLVVLLGSVAALAGCGGERGSSSTGEGVPPPPPPPPPATAPSPVIVDTSALDCSPSTVDVATSSPLMGPAAISGQWDAAAAPGIGFNYLTGRLAGACVDATIRPQGPPPGAATQKKDGVCNPVLGTQTYKIQVVETVEDLSKQIEASASLSARGLAWSAAASATFVENYRISTSSRFLLIEASVELRSESGHKFALTPTHAAILKESPAKFRGVCGDHYVRSVWYGGAFKAVFHFRSKTEQQARELTSSLRASVGSLGGLKTAGDLRSAVAKFQSTTETDVFVSQSGGGFSRAGTDPEALLEQLNTFFCAIDATNAPAVRLELAGYETLNTMGAELQYTGNHSDTVAEMERLRSGLLAERAHMQLESARLKGDCPGAADELGRVADARTDALQQLTNMIGHCRDLRPQCRRCTRVAKNAAAVDPAKTTCVPCATGEGAGWVVQGHCRKCSWKLGTFDIADSTIGEHEGENPLVDRSCTRMEPGAAIEVRAKGAVSMHLSDGACEMTCKGQGTKSTVSLLGPAGPLGSRHYCVGTFNAPKRTDFDAMDLTGGAPGWWSAGAKVSADGTARVGLGFLGTVYGCHNHQAVKRRERLSGALLEICQVGYCQL